MVAFRTGLTAMTHCSMPWRHCRHPLLSRIISSFGRCEASNPESRDSPMCNSTSEVWSCGPSRDNVIYQTRGKRRSWGVARDAPLPTCASPAHAPSPDDSAPSPESEVRDRRAEVGQLDSRHSSPAAAPAMVEQQERADRPCLTGMNSIRAAPGPPPAPPVDVGATCTTAPVEAQRAISGEASLPDSVCSMSSVHADHQPLCALRQMMS